MKEIFEPMSGELTLKYSPDKETKIIENPPRFLWIPATMDACSYTLEISQCESFEANDVLTYKEIPFNFFVPNKVFNPGKYYWRYNMKNMEGEETTFSRVREFDISENLPESPMPLHEERLNGKDTSHPRLWLDSEKLVEFKANKEKYCWDDFYKYSVEPYLNGEFPKEPDYYPNNQRQIHLWRGAYMTCQTMFLTVRNLSIAATVLDDETILKKAKEALLYVANWDTQGTTSRDYNDESSFRIAGAVCWGYDWLYNFLTEDEREFVLSKLIIRTQQVADHVMLNSKIHMFPYDSHAVRSLSSVITPCCIAMLSHYENAKLWLDYAIDYFNTVYTPWGGEDGGWAEGGLYWTTGMGFLIEAANLLKSYLNINLYARPFFSKTGDFPLHCYCWDTSRASFGDQSELGFKPGIKTGINVRQFAGVTGNKTYQWYYEQVKSINPYDDGKFSTKGWWDLYFDDMVYCYMYGNVPSEPPTDEPFIKHFRDIGWVAMHKNMSQPDKHIMLLAKSSKYGSISHSHGDQNSFLIHAFGQPLAIESGYYVGFNSTMHREWRRNTVSQNNIIFEGQGQYSGKDKFKQIAAHGKVLCAEQREDYLYTKLDACNAYVKADDSPLGVKYIREILFVQGSYFVVIDSIELEQPSSISWLIHGLHDIKIERNRFKIKSENAALHGEFAYCSSGALTLAKHFDFPNVDLKEWENDPTQCHLVATSKVSSKHKIITLLVPMLNEKEKYITSMIDDQGFSMAAYFMDEQKQFQFNVPKSF